MLVGVTDDHNLLLLDATTLELRRTIVGYNDEITDMRYVVRQGGGSGGRGGGEMQLAVGTNSEQVRLFDLADMGCRLLLGHADIVLALDASAGGGLIASASKDATVRLWDPATAECVGRCVGHMDAVGAVGFGGKTGGRLAAGAADGAPLPATLLSASKDKTLKKWDLSPLLAGGGGGKTKKKGATAASGEEAPTLSCLATVLAHSKEVNALAVAPNDRLAITGSQDRSLKVWTLAADGSAAIRPEPAATLTGHRRAVWTAAFAPLDRVAASGSADMLVKVWSMADWACLRTFEGHVSSVLKVRFLRGGALLASSGSDGLVKVWSIKGQECVATLDAHEDKVWAIDAYEPPSRGATGGGEGGGEGGGGVAAPGDGAECAICIGPFLPGEVLTRLPSCGHEFHQSCICHWLASKHVHRPTCPLCKALRYCTHHTAVNSNEPDSPLCKALDYKHLYYYYYYCYADYCYYQR